MDLRKTYFKNGVNIVFDNLFEICGVDLKRSYDDKQYIKIDGKNVFKSCFGISSIEYKITEKYDVEIPKEKIIPDVDSSVMFTLINDKYMYFNMTSYDFWKPKYDFISKTFNSANLGG